MKTVTTISEPRIDTRAEKVYMGIRVQTPFRGMFKVVGQIEKEFAAWFKQQRIEPAGARFLRYHVIDMKGDMDIEVGIPVYEALPAAGRVSANLIPAGRYASLIYSGMGLAGNKTLLNWGAANGIRWDRWNDPKGDAFRARYESYLTDPKIEPRKKLWQIELAIKLADD